MNSNSIVPSSKSVQPTRRIGWLPVPSGKIGYAFLWLLGVPLPILLVIYLVRGH